MTRHNRLPDRRGTKRTDCGRTGLATARYTIMTYYDRVGTTLKGGACTRIRSGAYHSRHTAFHAPTSNINSSVPKFVDHSWLFYNSPSLSSSVFRRSVGDDSVSVSILSAEHLTLAFRAGLVYTSTALRTCSYHWERSLAPPMHLKGNHTKMVKNRAHFTEQARQIRCGSYPPALWG